MRSGTWRKGKDFGLAELFWHTFHRCSRDRVPCYATALFLSSPHKDCNGIKGTGEADIDP